MKRFSLYLSDDLYDTFLRCFPDYGERTSLLRKAVQRLVKRAEATGKIWNGQIAEVADDLFNEMVEPPE